MRNRILSLTFLLAISTVLYSQTNYISDGAFRKMMQDQYRFAIVGSQVPVSGLKVETANPSITLKGNIVSSKYRAFIMNLELQGGLSDGVMQLFSGQKTSSYFKGTLGFNFLFSKNKGYYNDLSETEKKMTNHAIKKNLLALTAQMDTFAVIKIITDHKRFHDANFFNFTRFADEVEDFASKSLELDDLKRIDIRSKSQWLLYYKALIRAMLVSYGADSSDNDDAILTDFRTKVANVDNTTIKTKQILTDYDRLYDLFLKEYDAHNNRQYDFEIALTKFNWNAKSIGWINISAIAANSRFWVYNDGYKTPIDENSFTPGVTISYNRFKTFKEPHRYRFFRFGTTLQRVNNLPELEKFSYKEETVINAPPATLTKKTEGTAYRGNLAQEFGYDIFLETYIATFGSAMVPGVYAKPVFRHSKAWLNPTQMSLDLGLVWSITSSDKDAKSLLTIVPYMSWSNVLDGYSNVAKTEKSYASDRFSFNVKFGVPFNLGK
jgi:hypothetical protein